MSPDQFKPSTRQICTQTSSSTYSPDRIELDLYLVSVSQLFIPKIKDDGSVQQRHSRQDDISVDDQEALLDRQSNHSAHLPAMLTCVTTKCRSINPPYGLM